MDPQYLQYLIPLAAFLVGAFVVYIVVKAHTTKATEEAARMEALLKEQINALKDNILFQVGIIVVYAPQEHIQKKDGCMY